MRWQDTPVYVTNFNNLERGFRRLVRWLRDAGHENVTVVDNGSTWGPLLDYYESEPELVVLRVGENKGPYAVWDLDLHNHGGGQFVVTDPDVVPAIDCPRDLVRRMIEVRERFAGPTKVGPSLRIDNLPSCYGLREKVVAWEGQFWTRPTPEQDAFHAEIDTTFALYDAGSPAWPGGTYLRLAPPYTLEHLPWYEDSRSPSQELAYYVSSSNRAWTHWSNA